ncbi:MAG: undecaprenyl-phosphate glucose phosphotransferase, partial [Amphritea sp.]|nr:undecaprenyl-phosphate glucose phosphotransferase [Amphritea sp.]
MQNLADIAAVSILLFTLCLIKLDSVPPVYRLLAIVTTLCIWIIYRAQGVYRQSSGLTKSIFRITSAWSQVLLILALIGFITKSSEQFSREILLIWAVTGFAAQLANFFIIRT